MKRRNFMIGAAVGSLALAGEAARRMSAAPPPPDSIRILTGELLVSGFSGSDSQSPSAQALAAQIRNGAVGGVIFVKDNIGGRDEVLGLTKLFSPEGRRTILAIDHEGGAVQRLVEAHGCARLPSAHEVAARYSVSEAGALYAEAGAAVARMGFNLNLAPVVDLENPENPAIGHWGRSFSDDPERVADYARAFIDGFAQSGIACVLKHFPGQGAARSDSHASAPDLSELWTERDLAPFARLIREGGVAAVMSGYSLHKSDGSETAPAALSPEIVTGLLRKRLGFDGVALTDDLDMGAVGFGFQRRSTTLSALKAGNDLLVIRNRSASDSDLPGSVAGWIQEALTAGTISQQALDRSVQRVQSLRKTAQSIDWSASQLRAETTQRP